MAGGGFDLRHSNLVNRSEPFRLQDIPGSAGSLQSAVVQQMDSVAVTGREVKVVQHQHHGALKAADQLQKAVLIIQVEMVGGFIQQEARRGLAQCPGDHRTLYLSA